MQTDSLTFVKDVTRRSFKEVFSGELKQKRKRSGRRLRPSEPSVMEKNKKVLVGTLWKTVP